MKNKIYIKTQIPRSTQFKENISNINTGIKFKGKDFEFGICAVKYWGDFKPREEPLIIMEINGKNYEIGLNDFILKVEPILKEGTKGLNFVEGVKK